MRTERMEYGKTVQISKISTAGLRPMIRRSMRFRKVFKIFFWRRKQIHMKSRIFSAILAAILLSSCGVSEPDQNTETEAQTETIAAETEASPNLEAVDYGGYNFRVIESDIIPDGILHYEVYAVEETGEVVNDAVFQRNLKLNQKYNIQISSTYFGARDFKPFANSITAGEDLYDVVCADLRNTFNYSLNGYYREIHAFPHLDFEAEWWMTGALEQTSLLGQNYFAVAKGNINAINSMPVLFFNKQMAEDLALEMPYDTVTAGNWTFDALYGYCEDISQDLNGDGAYTDEDVYGLTVNSFGAVTFALGSGFTFLEKDDEDIPHFKYDERFVTYFQKVVETLTTGNTILYGDKYPDRQATMKRVFMADRVFFYNEMLAYASMLREMETDFGIVPMPKWDLSQKQYCTFVHSDNGTSLAIPITNTTDDDRVGRILEDYAYYSMEYVYPAYLDTTVKGKQSRDEESSKMIDIIISNVLYDWTMSNMITNNLRELFTAGSTDVVSVFAANQSKYETTLAGYVESVQKIIDQEK